MSIGGGGRRNGLGKGGGRGVGCFTGTTSTTEVVVVVTGAGVASFSGSTAEFGSVIHDGRVNPRPRPAITNDQFNCEFVNWMDLEVKQS